MTDGLTRNEGLGKLALAVVDETRVVTDADDARPGRAVHVEVLPGSGRQALAGYLDLEKVDPIRFNTPPGLEPEPSRITGDLTNFQNPPLINVSYAVYRDGQAAPRNEWARSDRVGRPPGSVLPAPPLTDVDILLRPLLTGEANDAASVSYEIEVTINVTISDSEASASAVKLVRVPVNMPPLIVPSVLLLGKYPSFSLWSSVGGVEQAGSLAVILPPGSPLAGATHQDTVTGLIAKLQRLLNSMGMLKPVLGWSDEAHAKATDIFRGVIERIRVAPQVFSAVGNIDDLANVGPGFASLASALMLLGSGTPRATLYGGRGYAGPHKTFEATSLPTLPASLALLTVDDFSVISWDGNDSGSIDDLAESVYWGTAIQ